MRNHLSFETCKRHFAGEARQALRDPRPFSVQHAVAFPHLRKAAPGTFKTAARSALLRCRRSMLCRANLAVSVQNPFHDELVATANYISQRGRGILGELRR